MTELQAGMFRNFYPMELYIERGQIKKSDMGIFLLTDDEAAIEEATLLHPEYDWIYFNKTRNRGVQQMHNHFPIRDVAYETLMILAEVKVASQCKKGVFGTSKFPMLIQKEMRKQHSPEDMKLFRMDVGIRKTPTNADDFMTTLEQRLTKARQKNDNAAMRR